MDVESVLVTGANRGIGLEFVRHLVQLDQPPRYIFATYRRPDDLEDLQSVVESAVKSRVILIKMDVTHTEEVHLARSIVEETVCDRGLTLLINNAGVGKAEPFPTITEENLEFHFRVNTVGPLLVLQVMLPLLEMAASRREGGMSVSRAAVVNLTSMIGSITNTGSGTFHDHAIPGYKISKAALNMAMRIAAASVKEKGILVIMMCPGWVKTDMGGRETAQLEARDSISAMLRTLSTLNEKHHGAYLDRHGNEYPF